jgi:glycosyltransferase involved in cell wall biosynthesis
LAFCPHNTFAIPQYYSTPVYTQKELQNISDEIVKLDFTKVIFSGFPSYFKLFIELLHGSAKNKMKTIDLYIIYHGSFASNAEDSITTTLLKEIIELNKIGYVKKIGFVKKGMTETINKVAEIDTHFLIPMMIPIENKGFSSIINTNELNLGVFTHELYRKNIHNQVAAALMFENANVHIHKNYGFDYLFSDHRLFIHPFFESYNDFLQLMGSMTLNFYVSFSECFGLVITESLALGVPCLAADNSGLFDYDEELKSFLIVNEFDDSNAIYKQAMIVLENRQWISKRGIDYVKALNKIAKEKFNKFLS